MIKVDTFANEFVDTSAPVVDLWIFASSTSTKHDRRVHPAVAVSIQRSASTCDV